MGFHHVAITTRDLAATHRFYTETTGFELVKVVAAATPEGGWARHVFYDTGDDGLLAVWDLHDVPVGDFSPAISTGLGLPSWANHIAFSARDELDLAVRRSRWQDGGIDVAEIDHGWCRSIYAEDPNGILVEFCTSTRAFTAADRAEAEALLAADVPPLEEPPVPEFHLARDRVASAGD